MTRNPDFKVCHYSMLNISETVQERHRYNGRPMEIPYAMLIGTSFDDVNVLDRQTTDEALVANISKTVPFTTTVNIITNRNHTNCPQYEEL